MLCIEQKNSREYKGTYSKKNNQKSNIIKSLQVLVDTFT